MVSMALSSKSSRLTALISEARSLTAAASTAEAEKAGDPSA
jgi:hypothetical protein